MKISDFRVCLITPEFLPVWGGSGSYCIELANALADKVELHVATIGREKNGKLVYSKKDIANVYDEKIDIHILARCPMKDTFFYNAKMQLGVCRKMPNLMRKYRFDLLHSNFPAMPDLLLKLRGAEVPSLTTIHTSIEMLREGTRRSRRKIKDMENSEKMTLLLTPYLYLCQKLYLSRSKNLIFVSNYVKNLVCSKYDLNSNIHLIHLGINTDEFSPTKIKELDYFFPQLADLNPIVLFVGRLTALKGIYVLIKAVREIVSRNREVHFVFAGPGNIDLLSNIKRNGIPSNRCSILGYVDRFKLPSLYANSSIFILPSYIESFGISVLEAMSTETLVIANNVGGVPEIIDNEVNGILLQPGDYKRLAEKVLFFLENERCMKKIARNARRKVVSNFTVEKMAERTMRIYKEIVGHETKKHNRVDRKKFSPEKESSVAY